MTDAAAEVMRVFVELAPDICGRRKTRRLLIAMYREVEAGIPDNGAGPVIGARRDACQLIRSAMRLSLVLPPK